jgi:hypothetical protein
MEMLASRKKEAIMSPLEARLAIADADGAQSHRARPARDPNREGGARRNEGQTFAGHVRERLGDAGIDRGR